VRPPLAHNAHHQRLARRQRRKQTPRSCPPSPPPLLPFQGNSWWRRNRCVTGGGAAPPPLRLLRSRPPADSPHTHCPPPPAPPSSRRLSCHVACVLARACACVRVHVCASVYTRARCPVACVKPAPPELTRLNSGYVSPSPLPPSPLASRPCSPRAPVRGSLPCSLFLLTDPSLWRQSEPSTRMRPLCRNPVDKWQNAVAASQSVSACS